MKSKIQNLICVTNRHLCNGDFLTRIEKIVKYKPKAILLREKDLDESVPCVLHNFADVALKLKADAIHMTFAMLRIMSAEEKAKFSEIGASCHSAEEARKAQSAGCTYIIAGHIFDTLSKKNIPPRGLDFFQEVIKNVTIPVYAIGGINKDNINSVLNAGASGVCVMSAPMQCENLDEYFNAW